VRSAAKRGLELRRKFKRGGTRVGLARARDLSRGAAVSDSTIKRMASYFARHAVDRKPGWGNPSKPTNGYIAWLLWGGDAGRRWANKVARKISGTRRNPYDPFAEGAPSSGRVLGREAEAAGVQIQALHDAFSGALSQAIAEGADNVAAILQELARTTAQAFFETLMSGVPYLRRITPQEQDDLMLFYLTVPYGTWLWSQGREREARELLKAAKARFLTVIGANTENPPPLAEAFEDPAISNELDRTWIFAQTGFQDAMETLADEFADQLYEAFPELPGELFASGVDDRLLRQNLVAQVLDRLPLAGYERFESGALEYGEPIYPDSEIGGPIAVQYGLPEPEPPLFDPEERR
jgi:hypothetical protein